jgi:hypothetical protein
MGSDMAGMYNYYQYGANSANAVSPWHTAVDAGASYVGIYGGFLGAAASSVYFLASPAIWFTPGATYPNAVPTVDATYVAPK